MRSNGGLELLFKNLKKAWDNRQPNGILCHRFKFIYFPISKVANSTMKTMIAELEGLPNAGNPHAAIPFEWVRRKDVENYPDYKRVVVVRNPWTRLISCYNDKVYWQRKESGEIVRRKEIFAGFARYNKLLGKELFHPDMTFDEFAWIVAKIPDSLSDRHFRSQYKTFSRRDGTSFVDCIVRQENFQEEMESFLSSVGANGVEIKHVHKSRRSNHLDQLDDSLADLIGRRYRRDIELLHYTRPQ